MWYVLIHTHKPYCEYSGVLYGRYHLTQESSCSRQELSGDMFFYDLYVGLHVRIPMSNWFTYLGIVSSNYFLSKKLKKLKDETLVVLYCTTW